RQAGDLLHSLRINALPILDRGEVVGLISRQDVDSAHRHGLDDRPVSEFAVAKPAWVKPSASLSEVRRVMLSNHGRLLMVGDPKSGPIGVLTRSSVFRAWAGDPRLAGTRRAPNRNQVLKDIEAVLGDSWEYVQRAAQVAESADLVLHLVGGTVRDVLTHSPTRDIDLVVEGDAVTLVNAIVEQVGGSAKVHETFHTARWMTPAGQAIDFASARTEFYATPAALPTVTQAGLRQDLHRRDFTINAMAISLKPDELGTVIDPFGGLADLKDGVIRVLHGLSFHDDPTRAWRAARFAARFEFDISEDSLGLMRSARRVGVFDGLGIERLGHELDLILDELQVERCFRLIRNWDLAQYIHSSLKIEREWLGDLATAQSVWQRFQAYESSRGHRQSDALWIIVGKALEPAVRDSISRLVPGPTKRTRLFVEGPEVTRQTLNKVSQAVRQAARDASTNLRADVAEALAELTFPERVIAFSLADVEPAELIEWWERDGREVKTDVDGDFLIAQGYQPGPDFRPAIRAAQRVAWAGGAAEEQAQAAFEAMQPRARKS
ncbi:MAG: CBS domain-containing protein, partial [Myxococcales bacterium]|nr:CBS domain-containing protein [Myxococcales bacterium]